MKDITEEVNKKLKKEIVLTGKKIREMEEEVPVVTIKGFKKRYGIK